MRKICQTEIPTMTDIISYKEDIAPALFMGAPVFADTGEMSAVLICQINATRINVLISDKSDIKILNAENTGKDNTRAIISCRFGPADAIKFTVSGK